MFIAAPKRLKSDLFEWHGSLSSQTSSGHFFVCSQGLYIFDMVGDSLIVALSLRNILVS